MNRQYKYQPNKISKQWSNQEGMTGIGIAVILGMIAFFALIAMRLFPVYMEHFSVTTHLENLATDSTMNKKTDRQVLSKLNKSLKIDEMKKVTKKNIYKYPNPFILL